MEFPGNQILPVVYWGCRLLIKINDINKTTQPFIGPVDKTALWQVAFKCILVRLVKFCRSLIFLVNTFVLFYRPFLVRSLSTPVDW